MNNAGRATPFARAPLPGADLGCQTFMRLQLICKCSIRKDAERTKGENRQETNHGQILPKLRPITAQRWAGSGDRTRHQPAGAHGAIEARRRRRRQTDDRIWLVSFMAYDLGYFDDL
jgi:hypothetical protein